MLLEKLVTYPDVFKDDFKEKSIDKNKCISVLFFSFAFRME